jgi:hypothetical protein
MTEAEMLFMDFYKHYHEQHAREGIYTSTAYIPQHVHEVFDAILRRRVTQ